MSLNKDSKSYNVANKSTKAKRKMKTFLIVNAVVFILLLILLSISPNEESDNYQLWTDIHLVIVALFVLYLSFFICTFLKLIQPIMESRARTKRFVGQNIKNIDSFSGEKFEEFLCYHFNELGYRVRLTPQTRDFGADIVLEQKGVRIVVQAKRYNTKVTNKAVQEIVAAKAFYKADKAMVVTNSYFTKSAKRLAGANDVELWDRDVLKRKFFS